MAAMSSDLQTAKLVDAYTRLSRESLPSLLDLYDEQASFKDPFNDVRGRAAIERIFSQMFDELREPRFPHRLHAFHAASHLLMQLL